MKRLGLIIFFLSVFGGASAKGDPQTILSDAAKAYDARRYKEAIDKYTELVDQGYSASQLYFNLANAYFRDNQVGPAIYYYELARKLEPNDEDVRINLAIASSKTIDKIDSRENFFISAVKTNVLSALTTTTWAWLSIAFIALASVGFFFYVIAPKLTAKRISFGVAFVSTIFFVLVYFLGYSALQAKYENQFAIVLVREAKVMNEPTSSASSKFSLHEGTKIRVEHSNGEWLLIKLDNGNEGWLRKTEVGII